jgi:hypothetical protein
LATLFVHLVVFPITVIDGRSVGQIFSTFMAVYYDEILAGNCFGQINVTPPPRPSVPAIIDDKAQSLSLSDEFQLSIEELYYIARQFLKGLFSRMNIFM